MPSPHTHSHSHSASSLDTAPCSLADARVLSYSARLQPAHKLVSLEADVRQRVGHHLQKDPMNSRGKACPKRVALSARRCTAQPARSRSASAKPAAAGRRLSACEQQVPCAHLPAHVGRAHHHSRAGQAQGGVAEGVQALACRGRAEQQTCVGYAWQHIQPSRRQLACSLRPGQCWLSVPLAAGKAPALAFSGLHPHD